MSSVPLRIYHGPRDEPDVADASETSRHRETVTIPLPDVLPLLADAVESGRTWLREFGDDEITISVDLYEVILAYQHYRRPPA